MGFNSHLKSFKSFQEKTRSCKAKMRIQVVKDLMQMTKPGSFETMIIQNIKESACCNAPCTSQTTILNYFLQSWTFELTLLPLFLLPLLGVNPVVHGRRTKRDSRAKHGILPTALTVTHGLKSTFLSQKEKRAVLFHPIIMILAIQPR